jgi:hypothetical protein
MRTLKVTVGREETSDGAVLCLCVCVVCKDVHSKKQKKRTRPSKRRADKLVMLNCS